MLIYNAIMSVTRYDFAKFTATKTDEGFLVDSPIIGRVGIQEYINVDGSIRKELRLPEEVFNQTSMDSAKGKPISIDHKEKVVTSKNANRVTIGTVLSASKQDGDNLRTDIVIHSPDAIGSRRELSLGYTCTLDNTSGEHPAYGHYDAIQRDIRINHLSVVGRGRAGVARLNMDSNEVLDDVFIKPKEQEPMTVKIKLDNGIEYEAAPEVAAELTKLRADALDSAKKLEAIPAMKTELQTKIDELQAKVDGIETAITAAKEAGRVDALTRLTLESKATALKVDHKDKTDREVKEAVIKAVRKDADLVGKSDVYVDAAFDMAIDFAPDAAMASQREAVNTKTDSVATSGKSAYQAHMDSLANKGDK